MNSRKITREDIMAHPRYASILALQLSMGDNQEDADRTARIEAKSAIQFEMLEEELAAEKARGGYNTARYGEGEY